MIYMSEGADKELQVYVRALCCWKFLDRKIQ